MHDGAEEKMGHSYLHPLEMKGYKRAGQTKYITREEVEKPVKCKSDLRIKKSVSYLLYKKQLSILLTETHLLKISTV